MLCQDLYHDPHVLETDPAITALATVQLSLGKTRWTGVWEGGGGNSVVTITASVVDPE